jgi:hypothetical protein
MSIISVNRHTIASNAKHGKAEPPIRVARTIAAKGDYGSDVSILDHDGNEVARFIYDPQDPILKCGARLVLQTVYDARINQS